LSPQKIVVLLLILDLKISELFKYKLESIN